MIREPAGWKVLRAEQLGYSMRDTQEDFCSGLKPFNEDIKADRKKAVVLGGIPVPEKIEIPHVG